MEVHGALLESHYRVIYASGKRPKLLRMLEMIQVLLHHRKSVDYVLIMVYSTLNFNFAWVMALLCRCLKKPYIACLHGGNLPARLQDSPSRSRHIFQYSKANIAPSGYLQNAFEQAGFVCECIPNPIQLNHYPFLYRTKYRPKLLWVRAFDKTYHPEMAIEVLAVLRKKYPEAALWMVGPDKDGSLAICQELVKSLALEPHVTFTGSLSKSQWVALSTQLDIFLNTTRHDNTPVSVLEAMALGLPVVSTSVGGMPYLIESGKNGLLSPEGNVMAMVENIQLLLESAEKAQAICLQARKKVEGFDWAQLEQAWLKLLQ